MGEILWWRGQLQKRIGTPLASANKPLLSSVLGIAEGKIGSADDLALDYYPEMIDMPEGEGPKAGRWAFAPNQDITFAASS